MAPKAAKPVKKKKPDDDEKKAISLLEFLANPNAANIKRLNETQMIIMVVAAIVVIFIVYNFLFSTQVAEGIVQAIVPLEAPKENTGETEEQKFNRKNKNASLPDGSKLTKEYVEKKTRLTRQIPFGDRETEFSVRLPSDWVVSNFARYGLPNEEKYVVLTNIARYYGPAAEDIRPFLWVETERLKHYITAEAYATAYMSKRGIAPIALDAPDERRAEALYVEVREFRTYAMRTLFQVQGNLMVVASFGAPLENYEDYKDVMGLTLKSFTLARPSTKDIEKIEDYKLLNVVKLKHYTSWQVKSEVLESTLHPSVELHYPQEVNNPKGVLLQGLIMVHAWRKGSQTEKGVPMREISDRLAELNMALQDPVGKPKDLPLRGDFTSIKETPYLALVNLYKRKDEYDIIKSEESFTKQEVWVTVFDNGYYEVYAILVTPQQDTNYMVWAQNWAAYDLLQKSLIVRGMIKN